jgi:hypothetical protein
LRCEGGGEAVMRRWHDMKHARKRLRIMTFVAISLSFTSPSSANPCRIYFSSKLEEIIELEKTTTDIFVIQKLLDSIEEENNCTFDDYILSSMDVSKFWHILKNGTDYAIHFQSDRLQFGFRLSNLFKPIISVRYAMWKQ